MAKKVIILGAAGVVLLLGAGGGLYASGLLGGAKADAATSEAATADAGHGEGGKEAAGGPGGHGAPAAGAIFYQLDPLAAPVIVDGRVKRQVLLTLSVQVSDLSAKNDLVAVMPRLRDAMLRELYRKPVVRNDGDGTINIDSVKTRMLAVAQGMLSAAKVQDVLIVKAIQVG